MAKKNQIAKVVYGEFTYSITAEMNEPGGHTYRVYKAWHEYRPYQHPLKHKKQIGTSDNFFKALMMFTSDVFKRQIEMIPAKELQALKSK